MAWNSSFSSHYQDKDLLVSHRGPEKHDREQCYDNIQQFSISSDYSLLVVHYRPTKAFLQNGGDFIRISNLFGSSSHFKQCGLKTSFMKLVASTSSSFWFYTSYGSHASSFHYTSCSTTSSQVCRPITVPCLTWMAQRRTVLRYRHRLWDLASHVMQMDPTAPARCIPFPWTSTLMVTSPQCMETNQMCQCHVSTDGYMTTHSSSQQPQLRSECTRFFRVYVNDVLSCLLHLLQMLKSHCTLFTPKIVHIYTLKVHE